MPSFLPNVLFFSVLCVITLFISSQRFVSEEVTPKWLFMMLIIGVMGLVRRLMTRQSTVSVRAIDIILVAGFFISFVSTWATVGTVSIYLAGLPLLYILIRRFVADCPCRYLFGAVSAFALVLAVQGIFQYSGLLRAANGLFAVTGSFDNPAGFAGALACALPLCFYFFSNQAKQMRPVAFTTAIIIAIAIILSGSRAGILAAAVSLAVWLLTKTRIAGLTSKTLWAAAIIILSTALYFLKKDSADGRLLIWRCTIEMIAEKPVFGHGAGAFQAQYMLRQADHLSARPESAYAPLADNVLHPFNEYLLLLSEHGLAGLGVVAVLGVLLVRAYRRNRSDEKSAALAGLTAIAVFSFFSYPFRYPFTWVILFLCIAVIIHSHCREAAFTASAKTMIPRISVFLLSVGLLTYAVIMARAEIVWSRVAKTSMTKHPSIVLSEYDKLHRWMGKNGLFLYNHAAVLHEAGEYEKSLSIIARCTQYFNDYDVQMLLADNYKGLGKNAVAEHCMKTASAMCPSRFMPLYALAKLYEAMGRRDDALALADKIIDKDVKIPSAMVIAIKNAMRRLIEEQEASNNPESEPQTGSEPEKDKPRQGETPKVRPNGATLPP